MLVVFVCDPYRSKKHPTPSESVRLSLARASPRVRMLTVVATLMVHYLDIFSDGITAMLYYRAGHTWWFYFCVGFMLIGPVSLAAVRLALAAFHTCGPPRVFRWHAWALALASLVHLDASIANVGVVLQSQRQGWKNNPLEELPPLCDKADGMLLSIQARAEPCGACAGTCPGARSTPQSHASRAVVVAGPQVFGGDHGGAPASVPAGLRPAGAALVVVT